MSLLPSATFAGPSQAEALWAVAGSTGPGGGVTQLVAGPNITLNPPTGEGVVTISASGGSGGGVTSVTASGAGITATPTTGAVVLANTGVTSLVAGAGISLSGSSGAVTVTNSSPFTGGGFQNFTFVPGTSAQQDFAVTGSCGKITLGFGDASPPPFVANSVGSGWTLNGTMALTNSNWNAQTLIFVTLANPPAFISGGVVTLQGMAITVGDGINAERRILIQGQGTPPNAGFGSPYTLSYVVVQGSP